MKIAVASGKGGTGKTLVSTNLASIFDAKCVYVDCDVEEPNGHLFLKPKITKKEDVEIPIPSIDEKKCTYCGRCAEVCQFNALLVAKKKVLVFPEMCHGCGSCTYFCPEKAISEIPKKIGVIEEGKFNKNTILTGRLNIGEPMAPPIIRKLHKKVNKLQSLVIYDSPPGTSCPMIETIKKVDYVVLVTEPTPFGLHDLKLAVEVVCKLEMPLGIVINKSMVGNKLINDYCTKENIKVLLEIPYSDEVARLYSRGELIVHLAQYKKIFEKLYLDIKKELKK
ncbi:MAG: ATP-binding protein [Candidatus Margulisbacteria bacterium]|nr:ATP-binding protein [Candidatus Margulisiibacteriota bacterium]